MEKYIVNVTFVMAHEQRRRFLSWMKEKAMPLLFGNDMTGCDPRLQTVIEVGGEVPGPEHGLSIALQADFLTSEAAHDWNDRVLPPVLAAYHSQFGPHALFFVTLLHSEAL